MNSVNLAHGYSAMTNFAQLSHIERHLVIENVREFKTNILFDFKYINILATPSNGITTTKNGRRRKQEKNMTRGNKKEIYTITDDLNTEPAQIV